MRFFMFLNPKYHWFGRLWEGILIHISLHLYNQLSCEDVFKDQLLCFLICLLADLSRFSKLSSPTAPSSRRKAGKGRKLRILLVGYNGARNTGSDVRVAAIARQLQELFEEDPVSITVMTLDAASLEVIS